MAVSSCAHANKALLNAQHQLPPQVPLWILSPFPSSLCVICPQVTPAQLHRCSPSCDRGQEGNPQITKSQDVLGGNMGHEQRHLSLSQVAANLIQPGFGHWQGWGSFCGQPVSVFQHFRTKPAWPPPAKPPINSVTAQVKGKPRLTSIHTSHGKQLWWFQVLLIILRLLRLDGNTDTCRGMLGVLETKLQSWRIQPSYNKGSSPPQKSSPGFSFQQHLLYWHVPNWSQTGFGSPGRHWRRDQAEVNPGVWLFYFQGYFQAFHLFELLNSISLYWNRVQ